MRLHMEIKWIMHDRSSAPLTRPGSHPPQRPELVVTREDGFKAVNYAQLVPVLAEAIKEQQAMIADLQAQVAQLQAESLQPTV